MLTACWTASEPNQRYRRHDFGTTPSMQQNHSFSVSYDFDVLYTRNCFAADNDTLLSVLEKSGEKPARCLVYLDAGLAASDPALARRIHSWFSAHESHGVLLAAVPQLIDGGEAAKHSLGIVERIGRTALELGICRHSYIITIGGGAVLDAVGLAASLIHRGIRQIRLPTTVLAQDDAGLGVKNGVNAFGNKNFFGCFQPPHAIINDSSFLTALDDRSHRAGIAEAVKVSLIKDAEFFHWIAANAQSLGERDQACTEALIQRCATLHLNHITQGGDPFESGSSRPLDYGHWAAHRLEVLSEHRLNHGEAVAIGLAIDCCYARETGKLTPTVTAQVLETLEAVGFKLWDEVLDLRDGRGNRRVYEGIEQFREHLGGSLTLAMPDGLGNRCDIHAYDLSIAERCMRELRLRAAKRIANRQQAGAIKPL